MKYFALIIASAVAALAQPYSATYTALYEKTVSAAAAVTSLQQPTSPSRAIKLIGVQIYCSVQCQPTVEFAGSASATASTAITSTSPSLTTPPTALFYTDSNATAPSVPMNKYVVPAGATQVISFIDERLGVSNTVLTRVAGQNVTVRTDSITGNVKVTWFWREE
jgi:hypothetical protein